MNVCLHKKHPNIPSAAFANDNDRSPQKLFLIPNARGRLASATVGGVTTTYGINGLGERVTKVGAGMSTGTGRYVYDLSGQLIGEYNATGGLVWETVYLGGTPVAVLQGTTSAPVIYGITADHLNAPHIIANGSGKAVWTWDHRAFGDTTPNQNPNALGIFGYNVRFPGQYYDTETGLSYNMYRDYSAATGRYVQSDPLGLAAGVNTYGYVGGNPITRIDPLGLVMSGGPGEEECILEGGCTVRGGGSGPSIDNVGPKSGLPQGEPNLQWWNVPGSYNGSNGSYELLYNPETNTIMHFLFKSGN